ncbi:MAG: hypothetical protein ACOYL3_17300 [Desulfuromonadaceae bacterium]
MTEYKNLPDSDDHQFPIEPRFHPVNRIVRRVYDCFASSKLAMTLLVSILLCCIVGVTFYRGVRAGEMIFGTLWFNALLVLLVVNVACCFFGRIWHRKLTLITFGMILFHLSFVSILGGVVYNSLFYFRGTIRLTEGETLPNGEKQSYDIFDHGRFFNFSRLKGETTLLKMHKGYKIKGDDKRVAYEIAVGEGRAKKKGLLYITNPFEYNEFSYFSDKEGYSLLIVLSGKEGKDIFGAYIPLQSIKQKNNSYLYTTGSKEGPGSFPFPQGEVKPLVGMQVSYLPSQLKERGGDALFQVWPLNADGTPVKKPVATEKVAIGETIAAGGYFVAAREVRYWVAMVVRYEPGKPIILASLWVALAGMVITTFGRMFKKGGKRVVES